MKNENSYKGGNLLIPAEVNISETAFPGSNPNTQELKLMEVVEAQ